MSVHLVKGDDPTLREAEVARLVDELVGDDERDLAVEEHVIPGRAGEGDPPGGAEGRALAVAAVRNAASSPPFMTTRRVVVVREAGNLTASDAEELVVLLDELLETTELVVVSGGGRLPANLTKAWKGTVVEVGPRSEATADVLTDEVAGQGVTLDRAATNLVRERLGEDAGRVPQLVAVLGAAFDDGTTLGVADVEPYLGDEGSVPAYTLTNAIESGDVPEALAVLRRLLHAPGGRERAPMHPLQVLGLLVSHHRRLLRLDDLEITSSREAVEALGGKVKEYPARKALAHARALGTGGVRRAFDLLHRADLDLKGARAIPESTVVEILVARLARLAGRGRSRSG